MLGLQLQQQWPPASVKGAAASMPRVWHCLELWRVTPEVLALPLERRIEYVEKHFTMSSEGPFPDRVFEARAPLTKLEATAVLSFFAVIMGGPVLLLGASVIALVWGTWRQVASMAAATLALALHPVPDPQKVCTSRFTLCLYKYFTYRWLWVDDHREKNEADMDVGWIGAGAPHGVFPIANVLCMPSINAFTRKRFIGAAASVVMNAPFLRYTLLLGGATDVSSSSLVRATRKKICVGIVPDGIAGIFQQEVGTGSAGQREERVALRSRKGLARLSLRKGIPIMPAYSLGNSRVFATWYDRFGIMEWLSRRLRMSIFIFWGRFALPLPFRTNISMLIGPAMSPSVVDENPAPDVVDAVHEALLERIRTTFDIHKASCGWGDCSIRYV